MGLTYDIEVRYLETGNIGAKVGSLGGKIKDLAGDFSGLGDSLMQGLSGSLDAIGSVVKGIAGIGAAAAMGIGAASVATIHMNDQLEGTKIALASIFTANGASSSFSAGLGLATTQISKMRKDAADLPGEFDDLVNIFQTIAPNTFRGGLGVNQTRALASQTMAAAAIMRLPMNVAAREMSALIEGRSGAHNILGLRMMGLAGGKAKEFNHLSEEERIKKLQASLNNLITPDVLASFQQSFTGLWSTAKQNFKTTAMTFGEPLFDSVKGALSRANNWFSSHQDGIEAWAHSVGVKLANAFEYGINWFKEYGPVAFDFATNAVIRIHQAWLRMEPTIARIGGMVKDFLADPKAIDKLEKAAKLAIGFKVGMPIVQSVGGAAMKSMLGGEAGGGSIMAALAAPEFAAVAAALVAVGIAAAGTALVLTDSGSVFHDAASKMVDQIERDGAKIGSSLSTTFSLMQQTVTGPLEMVGTLFVSNMNLFSGHVLIAAKALEFLAGGSALLNNVLFYGNTATKTLAEHQRMKDPGLLKKTDSDGDVSGKDKLKVPNSVTHINKVEIVVQSNQDPSRIARLTVHELAKIQKNTKSGFIPKWMGAKN